MKHIGTKTLETDRLMLRRFEENDAYLMFENWANDAEVTKYLTWHPHISVNETKETINLWLPQYDRLNYYHWVIILKKIDQPIGSIAVVEEKQSTKAVKIGYCLGKRWWNQGYATEALGALIRFFFEEVKLNRIEAGHDSNNPNSGKVMAKVGMQYEGTMRQAIKNNQGICDFLYYAILAEDYFKPTV